MEVLCCLCRKFESQNKVITVAKALKDDSISEGLQSHIGELVSIPNFVVFSDH